MDAERLKSVPPFDSLPDDVRDKFAVWVGELKVDAGRHLAEQGDYAYELYVIEEGEAEVQQDGETIAKLGPGEFFGEMGVLERAPRNATVIATAPMRLFTLSHWDVKRLEKQWPEAVGELRDVIEQRRGGSSSN
ncbi:MAG: family transcriptional regulator, cyclic receptor protein [Thermoleophilaceae bacterium]|jgi:CRP-like cAMP-binding protein|nr:family transcriptional regulator, cyclic receptor protein [Thermoleophilaceae bacterium]